MSEDLERALGELTPCRAPASLRAEVLAAVQGELRFRPRWYRRHAAGLAVAALLALAVTLNWATVAADDALQARMQGGTPCSGARMLARSGGSRDVMDSIRAYQELVIRLAKNRGTDDVEAQEDRQVDRNQRRPLGGDPTGYQCLPGLVDRLSA